MSFRPAINRTWLALSAQVFIAALVLPPGAFWPTLAVIGLALACLIFLALAFVGGLFVALCYGIWRERAAEARRQAIAEAYKNLSAGGKTSTSAEDWPEETEAKQ
jgi:hypothetical protein